MKNDNKIIGHTVVFLTLLVLIGLVKPLTGAIGRDDTMAILQVSIMLATGVIVMRIFIKSFDDASRLRK